jgi:hypothetical protein
MSTALMQTFAAITMVSVTAVLVVAYREYLVASSKRRMLAMLASVGLVPPFAPSAEYEAVMKEARQRCRHCACEDVCERWLRGDKKGSNTFCPNSPVFRSLAKYGRSTA